MVDLSFAFTLGLLAYFVAVAASVPLAIAALLLGLRVRPFSRALAYVAALPLLALLVVTAVVTVTAGPGSGLVAFPVVLLTLVGVWVLPVAAGRAIVRRFTDLDTDAALRYAVAGLPLALVASLVLFLAPGGPTRYNLLFLEGPVAAVAWAVFLAIVVFGPGLVGVAVARVRGGRKNVTVV